MLRLKKNKIKGFTIIEVLCTLSIISILFSYIMQLELKNIQIKKHIELKEKNICLLEAVSNELVYNTSYEELTNLSDNVNIYTAYLNIDFVIIKASNVISCFKTIRPAEPYIVLELGKIDDKVYKIKTTMHFKYANEEEMIECDFFKGNY